MKMIFIILGLILAYLIIDGIYFNIKCQEFEERISTYNGRIRSCLDDDWTDFRAKAGLSEVTGKNIRKLWEDIVKDAYPNSFKQIATLRLTLTGLYRFPQELVEEWMSEYRHEWLMDTQFLRDFKSDYRSLLNKPRFKLINKFFRFPKVDLD